MISTKPRLNIDGFASLVEVRRGWNGQFLVHIHEWKPLRLNCLTRAKMRPRRQTRTFVLVRRSGALRMRDLLRADAIVALLVIVGDAVLGSGGLRSRSRIREGGQRLPNWF